MTTAAPYDIDTALARRRFARKAQRDDLDTTVEDEIGRRLLDHLDLIKISPTRVLDIGTGNGHAAAALAERYPQAERYSAGFCLPLLQRAVSKGLASQTICTDITESAMTSSCIDLLHSNLTVIWCNDLQAAFTEFNRVLRPGGLLMLSVLGPDTLHELRECWAAVDGLAHVQQFPDMHDVGDALARAGFVDVVVDAERLTLEYQVLDRLFTDLRDWGVGNVCKGRAECLTGRARFAAMRANYEGLRTANNTLPATCEVAYVHAWSAPQSAARIPVTDFNPLRRRR